MILADRTRKARRGGRCALCPIPVIIGQQIGRIPGTGWAHITCVIAARVAELAELRSLMTEPPRPSERGDDTTDRKETHDRNTR